MANDVTFQDAVTATPPDGTAIATDEVAGVHIQLVKLVNATEDSSTRTGVAGDPIRVDPTGTTTQPVNVTAVTPGTGATSLGKAEDAPHTSGDVGVMPLAVRKDAAGTLASADGDYTPLQVDANGNLRVASSGGGGGVSQTDDSAFTVGTSAMAPAGAIYRGARDPVDDGDAGALAMTQIRGLLATLEDSAGVEMASTTSPWPSRDSHALVTHSLPSVGVATGAFTSASTTSSVVTLDWTHTGAAMSAVLIQLDGTWTSGGITFEGSSDSVILTTWIPTPALRMDNLATEADSGALNGEERFWRVNVAGLTGFRVRCSDVPATGTMNITIRATNATGAGPIGGTVTAQLASGTNNIGDVDVLTVPAPLSTTGNGTAAAALRVTVASDSSGFLTTAGATAQDAPVSGNPMLAGLRASDAEPAAMSADGDAVYAWGDRSGRFVTTQKCSGSATTSVAGSAASVTLLASNAARLGGTIFNDSTAILYVKFGATASTSSFGYKLYPDGVCDIPAGYTGVIDGIWASATGNARITEFS